MENVNFNCNVCQHSWNDDPMEVNECPNCGSDDFNQSGGGGFFKKNLKFLENQLGSQWPWGEIMGSFSIFS